MLKKHSFGIKLQTIHEAGNRDRLEDYSSKMGMYFEPKCPGDRDQMVGFKYSSYIEGSWSSESEKLEG